MFEPRDESEAHFVRRLESFSDIVIGFSLAEVTINLSIPSGIGVLFHNVTWLISYAWTFFVVCQLWMIHHRLFVRAFVPTRLTVPLHFLWLATVGLLVFLMQLSMRTEDVGTIRVAYTAYFGLYALNLFLVAAISGRSLAILRSRSPQSDFDEAQNAARRSTIVAAVIALLVALSPMMTTYAFFWIVAPSIFYGYAISSLTSRWWFRRPVAAIVRRPAPGESG